jgi:hypothetical protein
MWRNCFATGKSIHGHLYARVSTITDSAARTQTQLDKQIEHSVDREECLRRDREIRRALERMATKDELRETNEPYTSWGAVRFGIRLLSAQVCRRQRDMYAFRRKQRARWCVGSMLPRRRRAE